MVTAKQYRAKAAECTERLKAAILPADIRELQNLEQSFLTLAENTEWMADNLEKTISPGQMTAGTAISSVRCQEKNALGCLGAADPLQSIATPTKIQWLLDDAGSKGGLSQTARLRWQIAPRDVAEGLTAEVGRPCNSLRADEPPRLDGQQFPLLFCRKKRWISPAHRAILTKINVFAKAESIWI